MGKPDDQHQDKIMVYYIPQTTNQTVSDILKVLESGFDYFYLLSSEPKDVENLIKNSIGEQCLRNKRVIIVPEKINSAADAFRTIDDMSVASTDFVFVEGKLKICDILPSIMDKHKLTVKRDKNAVLTLVCSCYVPGHPARTEEDNEKVFVIDDNRKVLAWSNLDDRSVDLPIDAIESVDAKIRFDLICSGVFVCTPKIPALFTENFDFHDMRDLVKHALLEDEVVTSNLYIEEVSGRIPEPRNHFLSKEEPDFFSVPERQPAKGIFKQLLKGSEDGELDDFSDGDEVDDGDELDGDDENRDEFQAFFREVLDSLDRGFHENLKPNDLVLEINGSRYAYNVPSDVIGLYVVKAILTLNTQNTRDKDAGAQFEHLKKMLKALSPVVKKYVSEDKQDAQDHCLKAVEDYCEVEPIVIKYVQRLLLHLYQEDILSSEVIIEWYGRISNDVLSKSIAKFVEWLQEEEDSDSEEE